MRDFASTVWEEISVFEIDLQGISKRMPVNAIRNCLQIEFACRFLCFALKTEKWNPKSKQKQIKQHL